MKQVRIDEDDGLLACPNCGENYMHHKTVEVFARTEDADTGIHTTAGAYGGVSIDGKLAGNPSSRRGGVTISFQCEYCAGLRFPLHISQHKGVTFVRWGEPVNAPEDL